MPAIIKKNIVYSSFGDDIINNIESTATNKALSANMGRVLKEYITASDGTTFRFAHNSDTGKYGYIVADSEGADTFIPFSSGGGDAQKLYDALQYSGLVTEDITLPPQEIC